MAALFFKLANVPDDEADDIRNLLSENNILFYETHAGFFRVGLDAIWLHDSTQLESAKQLLQDYQQKRYQSQRELFNQSQEKGEVETLWQRITHQPIRFFAALVAVVFVLTLTLVPFFFVW